MRAYGITLNCYRTIPEYEYAAVDQGVGEQGPDGHHLKEREDAGITQSPSSRTRSEFERII